MFILCSPAQNIRMHYILIEMDERKNWQIKKYFFFSVFQSNSSGL